VNACYGLNERRLILGRVIYIFLRHLVETSSAPTQSRMQWVPGALVLWVKRSELTTHTQIVVRLMMREAYAYIHSPLCPHGKNEKCI
jgi:hypothetical protein